MKRLAVVVALCAMLAMAAFVSAETTDALETKLKALEGLEKEKRSVQETSCTSDRQCNSPHGVCGPGNPRTCVCQDGYMGDDCSMQIETLRSGVAVSGSVGTWGWMYYKFGVPRANGFVVELSGGNNSMSDCDIYVRRASLPTHTRFDWRDISLGSNARHEFDNPQMGDWYIGVFGFTRCVYTVKATLVGQCTNNCNGHGDCVNGACFCHSGYSGDACQTQDRAIELNTDVEASVSAREWAMFHVRLVQPESLLRVRVTERTAERQHDVDVYIRYDKTPTMFEWDYANATLADATVVSITDARAGYWYIGVYGFQCPAGTECRFSVRVETQRSVQCPNECSHRGTCQTSGAVGTCQCNRGYEGSYCGDKSDFMNLYAAPERGYVDNEAWNYYKVRTSSMNPIVVSLAQTSTHNAGDCDLFIKSGDKPTRFNFDYQDIGLNPSFNVTVAQPGQATWWIGVYGFSRCEYDLTVRSGVLPNDCRNGGSRPSPTSPCICVGGWSGLNCETPVQPLVRFPPGTGSGTVARNEWVYFNYTMTSYSSNIYISMKETPTGVNQAGGELWLFAASGVAPTVRSHDYSDVSTNTAIHNIAIQRPLWAPVFPSYRSTIIIGVYGNPFMRRERVPFELVAWDF